jgi:hypothetical protein
LERSRIETSPEMFREACPEEVEGLNMTAAFVE